MFIVLRHRWQQVVPACIGTVNCPEIPDVHADAHRFAVVLADDPGILPVMVDAWTIEKRNRFGDVFFFRAHRRHVYHERHETIVVLVLRKKRIVEIGHAAKTNATGRPTQKHQPHTSLVGVEVVLQLLKILSHDLVRGSCVVIDLV